MLERERARERDRERERERERKVNPKGKKFCTLRKKIPQNSLPSRAAV